MEELNINPGFQTPGPGSSENEEAVQMSFFQRLIGIIVSPSETMKSLIAKPKILFPILITAFSMVGLYLIRLPLYTEFLRSAMETAIAQQSTTQLTPAQIEAYLPISIISGLVAVPITSLIAWLVGTAVIFGLMKLFKGEGSFKQYLSITGYAYVIMLLFYILSVVVSFFSGSLYFNASLTNLTNLFMPDIKGSFVYGIIRGIDLFSLWSYAIMAIGIALVSKVSKAKVYSAITLLYIVVVLLGANSMKIM